MATLLFELVGVLSRTAARELRGRAEGPALSRAELMAVATLGELAGACCAAEPPASAAIGTSDLAGLYRLTAHDLAIVDQVRDARSK